MINLLPEKRRGNDETIRVNGVTVGPISSLTEWEVAYRLNRALKDRPGLNLTNAEIRKVYALALTLCPATYIDPDTLKWEKTQPPEAIVVESAINKALQKVWVSRPPKIDH